MISQGTADSWWLRNRGPTMLEGKYDFGFSVRHYTKDLDICLSEGERLGAELPVTREVRERYEKLRDQGKQNRDFSSIITLLDGE